MGGASGAELAAAVSNAGGLGLIGGAYGNPKFLTTELESDEIADDSQMGRRSDHVESHR